MKRFRLGNPGEMYRRSQWAYIPHVDPIGLMEEERKLIIEALEATLAYLTCIGPEP